MSTTAGTGFCRVTVAAPDARIDVALPEDVPLVDIYPEILQLSGQSQNEGSPTGYHLVRRDGSVLDAGRSLAEQRILDGDVLLLRPFAESLPPAVFDDVSDAVSSAVRRDRRRWSDDLMNVSGLVAGVLLLGMMAFVLWFANPVERDMHGLPGIIAGVTGVALVALSGVRARVYDDRSSSIALGLASLPHLMLAGSGVFGLENGEGPGRLHLLVGCVVVLIAAVLLVALLPHGDSPFVAAAFLAAAGTIATFIGILTDAPPREVAAVTAVVGIAFVAWLPSLSARFARLPIGYRSPDQIAEGRDYDGKRQSGDEAVDFLRIGAQARRGHELLLGLVAGSSALVAVAAGVILGFTDNTWAQLLALSAGLALILRARLFDYTSQVVCLMIGGLATILLLLLGMTLDPPMEALQALYRDGDSGPLNVHTVWFSSSVAMGAAIIVGVGLIVPNKGVSPFWGRLLDMFEGLVLLSLLPLCLAVLEVYAAARAMTS